MFSFLYKDLKYESTLLILLENRVKFLKLTKILSAYLKILMIFFDFFGVKKFKKFQGLGFLNERNSYLFFKAIYSSSRVKREKKCCSSCSTLLLFCQQELYYTLMARATKAVAGRRARGSRDSHTYRQRNFLDCCFLLHRFN